MKRKTYKKIINVLFPIMIGFSIYFTIMINHWFPLIVLGCLPLGAIIGYWIDKIFINYENKNVVININTKAIDPNYSEEDLTQAIIDAVNNALKEKN